MTKIIQVLILWPRLSYDQDLIQVLILRLLAMLTAKPTPLSVQDVEDRVIIIIILVVVIIIIIIIIVIIIIIIVTIVIIVVVVVVVIIIIILNPTIF